MSRSQVRCAGPGALLASCTPRQHSAGILVSRKLLELMAAHPDLSSLGSCRALQEEGQPASGGPPSTPSACQFVACAAEATGVWPTDPGFGHLMGGGGRLWHVFDGAGYRDAVAWAAGQARPLPAPLQDDLVYQAHFSFALRLARLSAACCAGCCRGHWPQRSSLLLAPRMLAQVGARPPVTVAASLARPCRRTITVSLDSGRSPGGKADAQGEAADLLDLLAKAQPWLDRHIHQRLAQPQPSRLLRQQDQQAQPQQPQAQPQQAARPLLPDSAFVVAFPSSMQRLQAGGTPALPGSAFSSQCTVTNCKGRCLQHTPA
jgi:hypothetical protein